MKLFSYNNKWAKNYNYISRGIVESNGVCLEYNNNNCFFKYLLFLNILNIF